MDELEQAKERLKIKKVIIKNKDSKFHLFYKNPQILLEADKLGEKISNLFEYKPKKPVEQMSTREFKKYKRSQKNNKNSVPQSIDYKKLLIFVITFFSIALVGAIVSWIYLSTQNLKPSAIFNENVEIFYTYTEGDLTENKLDTLPIKSFESKNFDNKNLNKYLHIRFYFKEQQSEFTLKNLYFKIKTSGRGLATFKVTLFDAIENDYKQIYYNDEFYFEKENSYKIQFKSNYKFSSLSSQSYIEFVCDDGKTQGLNGYGIYNMLLNRA